MTTAVTTAPATTKAPLEINEPNATIYVSNLDWKIKKPVLRRSLHTLFGRHGKILEIITLRKERLRGQAWVIYDHVSSATAALQAEQGFTFFGKDLKLAYAREKSDRVAKMDGTYVPKDRREKREREQQNLEKTKKIRVEADDSNAGATTVQDPSSLVTEGKGDSMGVDGSVPPSTEIPSNILFAESLPEDCNELMLSCLFRSYAGYKEVRIPRPGLAFIEFDEEPHASVALKALDGFSLSPTAKLNLKYGKS